MRKPSLFKRSRNPLNILYGAREFAGIARRGRFSKEALVEYRLKKLRETVDHAYHHSPYYRALFDSVSLSPFDIRSEKDLQKIPVLTKEMIRENYGKLVSRSADRSALVPVYTTGSSGTPLEILMTEQELIFGRLLVLYGYLRAGARFFDTIVYLENSKRHHTAAERMTVNALKWYRLDLKNTLEMQREALRAKKPEILYSYPSCLFLLAGYLREKGLDLGCKLRVIFTHGEVLTPATKALIERVFRCPVRNTYGSAEFNRIAFECGSGRMHLMEDSTIVESLPGSADDGGEEILVTSLYHRTMPFIRYRLGDRLIFSDEFCDCGHPGRIVEQILGRSDDFLTLPSGARISARSVNTLEHIPGILEYQILQVGPERIEVRVRPGASFTENSEREIIRVIQEGCLGEKMNIRVHRDVPIERASNGKLKAVVSQVSG